MSAVGCYRGSEHGEHKLADIERGIDVESPRFRHQLRRFGLQPLNVGQDHLDLRRRFSSSARSLRLNHRLTPNLLIDTSCASTNTRSLIRNRSCGRASRIRSGMWTTSRSWASTRRRWTGEDFPIRKPATHGPRRFRHSWGSGLAMPVSSTGGRSGNLATSERLPPMASTVLRSVDNRRSLRCSSRETPS